MNAHKSDVGKTASQVIVNFLDEHAEPSKGDWKALIQSYPQFAQDIADASLLSHRDAAAHKPEVQKDIATNVSSEEMSKALNAVFNARTPVLEELDAKVSAIKGPAIRTMASDTGLGSEVSFMNDILSGSVIAPKKILNLLAERFETNAITLFEVFQRAFDARIVPSFKAENGKPVVSAKPRLWSEAVNASSLSPQQKKEFLALDE